MWSMEHLPNLLEDMCDKGLIKLIDDSYKIKQTKERKLVEETNRTHKSISPFFWVRDFSFSRNPKIPQSLFLQKSLSTPELPSAQPPTPVKHPGDECTHNLVLFQNLLKEMEEIKRFTKSTEWKSKELEMALQNVSGKSNANYNNNENSPLLWEILKNHISNLEKELVE